jgi:signal transduction histidine kinase
MTGAPLRRLGWPARAAGALAATGFVVAATSVVAVVAFGAGGTGRGRQLLVALAAASATALVLAPVRRRVARLVAGRSRPEAEAVLERFTSRLGPAIAPEELLLQLAEALRASLRAARAEVWIVGPAELERKIAVPHVGEGDRVAIGARERRQLGKPEVYGVSWAEIWIPALLGGRPACCMRIAPVVNEGEPLAVLVVERSADDDFSTAEERVIAELARHLGLSLHNERLRAALETTLAEVRQANEELRASRARIVEAADAERRRIERDLHDGAQQRLIALSIELELARQALDGDQAAAAARLDAAGAAVEEAIDELTDLAHGIYPPILREAGLPAALRMAVRRHPSRVALELPELARQAPATEAAIYFAVLEALQNAAKHAPHADVTVSLAEEHGSVVFAVRDDGPGFTAGEALPGHGIVNIRDRIGAVGGTVEWTSAPESGTRVRGVVPVADKGKVVAA